MSEADLINHLLTTDEVARILGVSARQVRNLPIKFVRVGVRKRRYDGADLRRYIAEQKEGGAPCQSTRAPARRTITRNSRLTGIGYAEARKLQPAEKL